MCRKPYAAPCVALLYWFVLGCSLTIHEGRKTMWQKQCGSKLLRAWSLSLTCDFCKDAEQRLGGAGKVVCIDKACFHLQEEAFQKRFPRKKQGRHKANHFGNDRVRPANSQGRRKNSSSTILDRSQKTLLIFTEEEFQVRAPLCQPQGSGHSRSTSTHFWWCFCGIYQLCRRGSTLTDIC